MARRKNEGGTENMEEIVTLDMEPTEGNQWPLNGNKNRETETVASDSPKTPKINYDSFDFNKVQHLVPQSVKETVQAVITDKKRGWKSTIAKIYLMVPHANRLEVLRNDLVDYVSNMGTRHVDPESHARSGLRHYFSSVTPRTLELSAQQHKVDYNAFMSTGNKEALIEAIIDEMLRKEEEESNQESETETPDQLELVQY